MDSTPLPYFTGTVTVATGTKPSSKKIQTVVALLSWGSLSPCLASCVFKLQKYRVCSWKWHPVRMIVEADNDLLARNRNDERFPSIEISQKSRVYETTLGVSSCLISLMLSDAPASPVLATVVIQLRKRYLLDHTTCCTLKCWLSTGSRN